VKSSRPRRGLKKGSAPLDRRGTGFFFGGNTKGTGRKKDKRTSGSITLTSSSLEAAGKLFG